ncbi:MAG: ABC transporter substrate-binding protein [Synergistaceae bacterium]|jgi:NitT/TauT family transport system substrate-binding protein|nr:ABC transporter substrate-binding protein [Synergistaceae bacterium]
MKKKIFAAMLMLALVVAFTTYEWIRVPASAPAASLEQTKFNLGHLNSTAHLLAFVAAEEGFFNEESLNVILTQFASASDLAAGLTTGKLDAAFIGSVPVIAFQSQGQPLTIFGGAMTNGHGYVVKQKFVEGLSDDEIDISVLKGLRVATTKPSVQDLELQILLTNAGLTYSTEKGKADVTIVYFDSQKDAYNAILSAEIDAVSVYSPYASRAISEGYRVIYYCSQEEEFLNQPCCRQVAESSALTAKPDTFKAFERALIKAYKFSQESREKTIDDVAKYIQIDRSLIKTEVYGGYSQSIPDPDKTAMVALKSSVVEFGYTKDYDIEPLYNTNVYEAALRSLLKDSPGDKIYAELLERFENSNGTAQQRF